jgi:radical S-adenosyl methionine domain-containing protein 2
MKLISVNFHMLKECNYHCHFCFATFPEIHGRLSLNQSLALLEQLSEAGVRKINFAGGEPTLHPHLGTLLERTKALGMISSIVTNGARLEALLEQYAQHLDWAALSVDSDDESIELALGRGTGGHVQRALQLFEILHRYGIRTKLNTVVTRLNHHLDMSSFVRTCRPERWKIFQVLPVAGQNDGGVQDLVVSGSEFKGFVDRHAHLAGEGITVIPERNELMLDSYVMINPIGQFYNTGMGKHLYSSPILEVGIESALSQVGWNADHFIERDGDYNFEGSASKAR